MTNKNSKEIQNWKILLLGNLIRKGYGNEYIVLHKNFDTNQVFLTDYYMKRGESVYYGYLELDKKHYEQNVHFCKLYFHHIQTGKEFILNYIYHREKNLTATYVWGTKYYYKNGRIHRDKDLPAIEYSSGRKEYYKNGQRFREGNLPEIEYPHAHGDKNYKFDNFIDYSIE